MHEDTGDIWSYPADARCVTTNGIVRNGKLVMGAGIALQAKRKFRNLDKRLGELVFKQGNNVFYLPDLRLISFPTKYHFSRKSDIELIRKSAQSLVACADAHKLKTITLPRPGCGCGGLKWSIVKEVIEPILDNRFIVLTHA